MNLFRRKLVNDAVDKAYGNESKHISHSEFKNDPEPQNDPMLQNNPEPQDETKEESVNEKTFSKEEKQILFLRKLHILSKELGGTNKVMETQSVLWTSDDMSRNSTPMSASSPSPITTTTTTLRATSLKKASVRSPLIRNDACGDLVDFHSYAEDMDIIDNTSYKIENETWEVRAESECLPGFVRSVFLQLGACNEGIFGRVVTSEEKLDTLLTPPSFVNETLNNSMSNTQKVPNVTDYAAVAARMREHNVFPREISLPKSFEKKRSELIPSFKEDELQESSNYASTPKVASQYPGSDAESSVFDSEWFTPEQPERNRAGNMDFGSMNSSISSRFSHRYQ